MATTHNKVSKRIVIYAKDVALLTGRKTSASNKLLRKIRFHFNKKDGDFVSINEFCEYTGLDIKIVEERIVA